MRARHVLPFAALCAAALFAGCGGEIRHDDDQTDRARRNRHRPTHRPREGGRLHRGRPGLRQPGLRLGQRETSRDRQRRLHPDRAGKAWECIWTVTLYAGQITVEGPFYDGKDSTLAITGGTGDYSEHMGRCSCTPAIPKKPNTTSSTKSKLGRPAVAQGLGEGPELVAEEVERHRDGDGDRLGGEFAERGADDQRLEDGQVDQQGGDADGEEAGRLEVRRGPRRRRRSSGGSRRSCW